MGVAVDAVGVALKGLLSLTLAGIRPYRLDWMKKNPGKTAAE